MVHPHKPEVEVTTRVAVWTQKPAEPQGGLKMFERVPYVPFEIEDFLKCLKVKAGNSMIFFGVGPEFGILVKYIKSLGLRCDAVRKACLPTASAKTVFENNSSSQMEKA